MRHGHMTLVSVCLVGGAAAAGSVVAVAGPSPDQPSTPTEAPPVLTVPQGVGDSEFSPSEVRTFSELEEQFRAMEQFPGFVAIGGPDGSVIGYVKTSDLMSRIMVPMGQASPRTLPLHDDNGSVLGTWGGSTDGWTFGEGSGETKGDDLAP